jgi:ferrous iron transport protein A
MNSPSTHLTSLPRGHRARIDHIEADEALTRKLLEMGLLEGMELRIVHEGPFRRDPIAIEINDRCVALRRKDAAHIFVSVIEA